MARGPITCNLIVADLLRFLSTACCDGHRQRVPERLSSLQGFSPICEALDGASGPVFLTIGALLLAQMDVSGISHYTPALKVQGHAIVTLLRVMAAEESRLLHESTPVGLYRIRRYCGVDEDNTQ